MARSRSSKQHIPLTTVQQLGSLIKSARDIMRKDKGLNGDLDRLPMLTWIMFLKFLDDLEHMRKAEAKLYKERFRPTIATPRMGGIVTATILTLLVIPALYLIWRSRNLNSK